MPRDLLANRRPPRDLLSEEPPARFSQALEERFAPDPEDVDLETEMGIRDLPFRAGFSRMTTPEQRAEYLNRHAGPNLWGMTKAGAYYLYPESAQKFGVTSSRPVKIDENQPTWADVADWMGDLPSVLGAVGYGTAASGLGLVPGMLMAGLGAGLGKAADEIIKGPGLPQLGLPGQEYPQSPSGVADEIVTAGMEGAGGEILGRATMGATRFALGPNARRLDPAQYRLATQARKAGYPVFPGTTADAPILSRTEGLLQNVFRGVHESKQTEPLKRDLKRYFGVKDKVLADSREVFRVSSPEREILGDFYPQVMALAKPGKIMELMSLKSKVTPDVWEQVRKVHVEDLLRKLIQETGDPLRAVLDPLALRHALDSYGRRALNEIHGAKWTNNVYKFADNLAMSNKKLKQSGNIVAANLALHPIQNLPKIGLLRGLMEVLYKDAPFEYLTQGIILGPGTKAGAAALTRFASELATLADDETGGGYVEER